MNRALKRFGLFLAAALPAVAITATAPSAASAAPPHADSSAISSLFARPYRATYLGGVTTGSYSVDTPPYGIITTLRMTGQLTSSGGCYTAQVGIRQSAVWRIATVATACSSTPVVYNVATGVVISLSPAFGVRVCQVGGGCGAFTELPPFGITS